MRKLHLLWIIPLVFVIGFGFALCGQFETSEDQSLAQCIYQVRNGKFADNMEIVGPMIAGCMSGYAFHLDYTEGTTIQQDFCDSFELELAKKVIEDYV